MPDLKLFRLTTKFKKKENGGANSAVAVIFAEWSVFYGTYYQTKIEVLNSLTRAWLLSFSSSHSTLLRFPDKVNGSFHHFKKINRSKPKD